MDWGGPGFVLAIIAISTIGWVLTTAIRAKHGYPVEGEWGGTADRTDLDAARRAELLSGETERLRGQVARLEERIAVLERIATDQPSRLSRDIDALR